MLILSLRNTNVVGRLKIVLLIGLPLILSTLLSSIRAQDKPQFAANNADGNDKLAYVSDEGHLMLYDPRDRTETTLLDNVQNFKLARDGRVAFTRPDETDNNLYVFDPSTPALPPTNISQNRAVNNYPLAWSPDGRYLAFGSYNEWNDKSLYVWDGETTINVMADNGLDTANTFYIDWSRDGRLAFTILRGSSNLDIPAEIYLWDGNTTTNLSQNREGFDSAARWSKTGQLMFGSSRDKESNVCVWDGVSFRDGSPDVNTFVRIAPELQPASVTWTDDNDIVGFTVYPESSPSGTKEIVLWDIKREAIVEQFQVASDQYWSWLAEGGQVIMSSQLASGIPSVYLDVENTKGDILFSAHVGEYAWSSDGYLAYCGIEEGFSRILSIWDGAETWVVAKVSYKPVQWQNGRYTFSCNNG